MELEWMIAAVFVAVGTTVFGQFEDRSPVWRRLLRWMAFLAVLLAVQLALGRPWTFVWIGGLPLIGTTFHIIWCARNGINPLTAEPRDRYLELRGWTR